MTITPRAFVGDEGNFDIIGATWFAELVARGLRERHYLLDIGAGCLRVGKYLIPYLGVDHYYAVEPNRRVLAHGIDNEAGAAAISAKLARFSLSEEFDFTDFRGDGYHDFEDVPLFDFAFAGSIFSHTDVPMTMTCLRNVRKALTPGTGVFHATFIEAGSAPAKRNNTVPGAGAKGWYGAGGNESGGGVHYTRTEMEDMAREAGFEVAFGTRVMQHIVDIGQTWVEFT